jgi:hypothetical protein
MILVDGDKLLVSTDGPSWIDDHSAFFPRHEVSVFDGVQTKTLYDKVSAEIHAIGYVYKLGVNPETRVNGLLPFIFTYRALDPHVTRFDKNCRLVSDANRVQDRICVLLEQPMLADTKLLCWADRDRDFVIVRCTIETLGKTAFQMDFTYNRDQNGEWVPQAWKAAVVNDETQKLLMGTQSVVTEYGIKEAVSPGDFTVSFPAGTYVQDYESGVDYIVRANGTKRIITSEENERGATYEELMAGEPGFSWSQILGWIFAGVAALAAVIVISLWLRRRAQGKAVLDA